MKEMNRLSLTKEGKLYLAVTLGVGVAALNTGNNLMYLLLGWLLSMIIASGILSNIAIKGLRLKRRLPQHLFANRPFPMGIEITNTKRFFTSYAVEFFDEEHPAWERPSCLFVDIKPKTSKTIQYQHWISKRGLVSFDVCWVATRFPFGLFIKRTKKILKQTCLVYPAVDDISLPAQIDHSMGRIPLQQKGASGDFYGLRHYRHGDEWARIDWKSSAKTSKIMIREVEKESQKHVTLVLDNQKRPKDPMGEESELEQAIRIAASLAHFYTNNLYHITLICRGVKIRKGFGQGHLHKIYKALALLGTEPLTYPLSGTIRPDNYHVLCVAPGAPKTLYPIADRVVNSL